MNTRNRFGLAVSVALFGVLAATPAAAQWKWRDKAGHTQYSDLPPPPGVAEGDILQRPASATRRPAPVLPAAPAASAAPLSPNRGPDPELEAKRKQAEQEVADKNKADEAKVAAVRAENCSRARAQMRTLDSGQRIARVNEKGERIVLDDAARAAESQTARDAIASECK